MAAVPPPPPPTSGGSSSEAGGGEAGGGASGECYAVELERAAALEDIVITMRDQLIMLVRWAKLMRCFRELDSSYQVAVIKAGSAKHLLLGTVFPFAFAVGRLHQHSDNS